MSLQVTEPLTNPTRTDASLVSPTRLAWIGVVLIGLGVARGWRDGGHFVRYVSEFGRRLFDSPSAVPWSEFSGMAWASWPVVLGCVLIAKRSPRLLKAAGISALALGLESLITLIVGGLFDSAWSVLYQGGYDRTVGPVLPRGVSLGLMIASALSWLGIALVCFLSIPRRPRLTRIESFQEKRARRKEAARLVNAGATLFAASVLALVGWTSFITALERLPWFRTLVINGDPKRSRTRRPFVQTAEMRKTREAERFLNEAQGLSSDNNFVEARRAYIKAATRFEELVSEHPDRTDHLRQFALAANNLAWFLATCPDESMRDAEVSVIMAKKAVAASPNDGNSLNTLAVAQFRLGDLDAAVETFNKSMALRDGGDSFDWYFLAQIEARKNRPQKAREWYDKAVKWASSYRLRDAELFRFQLEAAKALGLPTPEHQVSGDDAGTRKTPLGIMRRMSARGQPADQTPRLP